MDPARQKSDHDRGIESDRCAVDTLVGRPSRAGWIGRYAVAAGLATAAILLRTLLAEIWGTSLHLIVFTPAVLVAAWLGGLGPGLVVTTVCTLTGAYLWAEPIHSFRIANPREIAALISFATNGVMTSILLEALNRTHRRLEGQSVRLERRGTALARSIGSEHNARAAAEAANRSKDAFLATLSHELRNPLAAITAAVRVLDNAGQQEIAAHARQVVQRQTAYLTRMVDDLLDVGRMMSGKIRLERQRVDIADIVVQCVASLREGGALDRRSVSVDARPVFVDGDILRLAQIVTNLLTNAAKYTPAGGSIHVEVTHVADEAVLRVEDTGIGIAPELLPQIFELFGQGDVNPAAAPAGLGIGLTVVRRLVDLHGGRIQVSSDGPGRGTAFVVTLPRADVDSSGFRVQGSGVQDSAGQGSVVDSSKFTATACVGACQTRDA